MPRANHMQSIQRPIISILAASLLSTCIAYGSQPSEHNTKHEKIFALYQEFRNNSMPAVPEVTTEDLLKLGQDGKIVLVDVRETDEMEVSNIPGAISQSLYEQNIDEYRGQQVVVYCTIGIRSWRYTKQLRSKGIEAFNLVGGVLLWAHSGETFDHNGEKTNRVHVYVESWNLLPKNYKAAFKKNWYRSLF